MAGAGGICKFYLQGNCKFGDRCWHPHSKGGQQHQYGGSPGFTQNRYSLVNKSNTQQSPAASATSLNETIKNITAEMEIWGTSKMWPFSCYAHNKESMCMPGFDDFSPDEMRFEAYNENRNPAAQDNYKAKEAQLGMEYNLKRDKLKNPTGSTKQDLIKFIEEAKKSSSSATKGQLFSTNSAFGNTASATTGSSVFGGSKTASAFGAAKSTSAFGTSSSTNLFGKGPSANANSSSAFSFSGAATGATTQSSAFGASSPQSTLFKPATFGAASAFGGSSTTQTSAFGGSMATQPATLGAGQSSVFGAASGFGAQTPAAGFGASASSPAPGFGTMASTSTFGASPPQTSAGFGSAANQTSTSLFGAMPTNQTSAFGATAASQPSAFGGTATQTSAFGSAATANQGFGATSSTVGGQPTGLFGKPASGGLFGKPVQESATADTASGSTQIYTALDQITLEEKAEFEAPKFTLGRIPTRPPPKEYV